MSAPFPGDSQEEIDSKKRKKLDATDKHKSQITSHFQTVPKTSKSPSALKKSTYTMDATQEELEENNDPVCTGTMATYLYLMVDVPPDRDYIGRYRTVLSKLFSSMKSADPNAVIIPYESSPDCEESFIHCPRSTCIDNLTKIPRSVTQLQKYFPRGKPKRGGGTVFTNFLLLHDEEIEDMIIDMKDGMEAFNTKIGKQRVQHHDVVKLGYIMFLTPKIELSRWTEFLQDKVQKILQEKVLMALSVAKINDGTGFKDNSGKGPSISRPKKKTDYWGVHIETVKSHQVKVKRAICQILASEVPAYMYGMELRFMPQMRYDMDSRQKQRLRNAMMVHGQVLANLVEYKLTDFEDIDSSIKNLDNKTIRELIMSLESKSSDRIFIAIERSWQGELSLWAKRKFKADAEIYSSHMAAWLMKIHGKSVLAKLDPDMQNLVSTVIWRDDIPLYPEEAEIEDASKINLDWLIDIKELDIMESDNRSVMMDDTSIVSFSEQSFFSTIPDSQKAVEFQEEEIDEDASQHTTDAKAQGSQGVGGYDKPPALT